MKATKRTTRWLLIALLFGFLAVTGLTLAHRHGVRTLAKVNDTALPTHTNVAQRPLAALIAPTGGNLIPPPAGTPGRMIGTYSNSHAPSPGGRSGLPSNAATAIGTAWSNEAADPAERPVGATQPTGRTVTPNNGHPQPAGAGDFAYDGYAPLDCELPAGCGVTPGTGHVGRQPSGTSAGLPSVHDSQGSDSGDDGSGPQTHDGGPHTTDTGQVSDAPGQNSGPGSKPVAAAPELDPATLAGAVTLLLGSLAVLRGRRARAAC